MRPAGQPQSALHAPLNAILGTEANVRILRVLALSQEAMSPPEVARRARLMETGVRRALDRLVEIGILEQVGVGKRRQVRLRAEHSLAVPLRALFQAELERVGGLFDDLSACVARAVPPPLAAWVEGPLVDMRDTYLDSVRIGVLAPALQVDGTVEWLQNQLVEVERARDVQIEVHGCTPADLEAIGPEERARLARVIFLAGASPLDLASSRLKAPVEKRSHAELDERGRRLAGAIADRIAIDPTLVERAREHVERRMRRASAGERKELEEWARILSTMPIPRLRRFLVDDGERATRLRQTLPFLDALEPSERDRLLREDAA